ncbi:serine hydrolase [Steroidobacter sp. S1-65]|uniref:Serine hydrolase n=1 Tax=Steroidobacter gossypii TaxID=2805490 RepID=A0ABS1WZY2_9GAMM|nr:serine hydrolase [Steroidobacter gossypii]MBM0106513.1 serine hydrolase [Steroidobacter gossypii]
MSRDIAAELEKIVKPVLHLGRVPGLAIGIVRDGRLLLAEGYGYRDLEAKLPMTARTAYPIASTTKAINATTLGVLVDERVLSWDQPVQRYAPNFRISDAAASAQVTLRDLLSMRTGLPRHDWVWMHNSISRAQLLEAMQHLEMSAPFRDRFQYNNLSVCVAGHIAEIVTGQTWESLVQRKLLDPVGMTSTSFKAPADDFTRSYHETIRRELLRTQPSRCEVTAPSGGAIHSTVEDMTRWLLLNMNGGRACERTVIHSQTLAHIHAPQIGVGSDLSAPSPNAAYAMGWFVDTYNGHARLSHGGYLDDVNSSVMLFPAQRIGVVCFLNFGPPALARLVNQHVFDLLMGLQPAQTLEQALALYESKIEGTCQRNNSIRRVENTSPSHVLSEYEGRYEHPAYGMIDIRYHRDGLELHRGDLALKLNHWHYDAWVAEESDLFPIHVPHVFDRSSRLMFESSPDGEICGLSVRFEPAARPIQFYKRRLSQR